MPTTELVKPKPPRFALATYPDTDRYKCRFELKSETSDQIYRLSFDAAKGAGYWTCSCRGNIAHGQCKHLTACGLRGRVYGKDLGTLKAFGLAGDA